MVLELWDRSSGAETTSETVTFFCVTLVSHTKRQINNHRGSQGTGVPKHECQLPTAHRQHEVTRSMNILPTLHYYVLVGGVGV